MLGMKGDILDLPCPTSANLHLEGHDGTRVASITYVVVAVWWVFCKKSACVPRAPALVGPSQSAGSVHQMQSDQLAISHQAN